MKKLSLLILVVVLLMSSVAFAAQSEAQTPEQLCAAAAPVSDPANRSFTQAEQVLEAGVDYRAIFCTGAGPVYVDLFENETPITVNNFVFLAQQGFYNNTTFHRVIQDFMAQGGDPTATGTGGPNYQFQNEIVPTLTFDQPGRLAMANAGPDTNGSQFFITTGPATHLNGGYNLFGQVIQGEANVRNIQLRDPATATEPGTALDTVLIITDPTTVLLEERTAPTQDEVVAAMDQVDSTITADISNILENQKGVFTTDELVSAAPEAIRDALSTLLTTNNHEYRVSSLINNKGCDLTNVQFISLGYTIDAFATPEDAAAALADPAMAQLPLQNGFTDSKTEDGIAYPVFTAQTTACDQPAIHAMTYWQHGAFVVTAEMTVPAEGNADQPFGAILTGFVGQQLFEPFLGGILYRDIE